MVISRKTDVRSVTYYRRDLLYRYRRDMCDIGIYLVWGCVFQSFLTCTCGEDAQRTYFGTHFGRKESAFPLKRRGFTSVRMLLIPMYPKTNQPMSFSRGVTPAFLLRGQEGSIYIFSGLTLLMLMFLPLNRNCYHNKDQRIS